MKTIFKITILTIVILISVFFGIEHVFAAWSASMNPKTLTVYVGGTGKVTALQTGTEVVNTLPSYTSSNTAVATVERDGTVKGIKPGTVTITGKYGSLVAGTTTVTVKANAVWAGEMSPKTLTVYVGGTGKVSARQTGDIRVKTPAYYTSSNPTIATVDPNTGVVKGIKPGTATITGKFGKYVAGETTITVKDVEVWEGTMVPTNLTIIVGDSAKVTAKQTGSLKVNTLPTYYCNDTSVISIDKNGTITGLKPGTATITGRFGDLIAGNTDITVLDVSIKDEWVGMTVLEKSIIPVGETSEASIKQDGKYKIDSIVTYTSSDPSVASVDANGVVKALKPGKAVITGKVGNNLIASEAEINVSNKSKSKLIIISSIIVLFSGLVVLIRKSKHQ